MAKQSKLLNAIGDIRGYEAMSCVTFAGYEGAVKNNAGLRRRINHQFTFRVLQTNQNQKSFAKRVGRNIDKRGKSRG